LYKLQKNQIKKFILFKVGAKEIFQNKKFHQSILGGFDAVKNQYPNLIECVVEALEEKCELDPIPSSPTDAVDKENFTMTEILPHIFVGMYSFIIFFQRVT
jgi:hypothetical protein